MRNDDDSVAILVTGKTMGEIDELKAGTNCRWHRPPDPGYCKESISLVKYHFTINKHTLFTQLAKMTWITGIKVVFGRLKNVQLGYLVPVQIPTDNRTFQKSTTYQMWQFLNLLEKVEPLSCR